MVKILSCTNNKKQGKADESEAGRPSSITCPSQVSTQLLMKRYILNFLQQIFFLVIRVTGQLDMTQSMVTQWFMSRRQFASVGEQAWCIASSTVGRSLGPLIDHNKVCQKIEHPAVYTTQLKLQTSIDRSPVL